MCACITSGVGQLFPQEKDVPFTRVHAAPLLSSHAAIYLDHVISLYGMII